MQKPRTSITCGFDISVRADKSWLEYSAKPLFLFLKKSPACMAKARKVCSLSDAYYRQPGTESDRIILENDCLILQNIQTAPLEHVYSVVDPSVCVVAQGGKEFLLGESHYRYDPLHYLLTTVDLPTIGQILEASKERPFLSLRLSLDAGIVSSVMLEAGYPPSRKPTAVRAIDVSVVDANLLNATVQLTRLLDSPAEAPLLLPLIMWEIVYRLLMGEQGVRLRHLATLGEGSSLIARAVERIRQDFDRPLRVEQLSHELGMSVSGFHQHFKTVTALSPLQFQKRLRLQEARRLMLSEQLDAASAAYRVGYQDAAHFNREYKSLLTKIP